MSTGTTRHRRVGLAAVIALTATLLLGGPASAAGPTADAPEPPAQDVPTLLAAAALRHDVPLQDLARIAWCESRWDPNAIGPGGVPKGLFQFTDRTWSWASAEAGYAGASVWDAEANAMAAAWLMAQPGGRRHWTCR
jgi:hypothetical protein